MSFQTEQEKFWAGQFGSEYIKRNQGADLLAANLAYFSKILSRTRGGGGGVNNYIEFGANIGMNIQALKLLLPNATPHAIEINQDAVHELQKIMDASHVYHSSILEWEKPIQCDLVFTKGVLIHISPEHLPIVYKKLVDTTKKYLVVSEYYDPNPVEILYRGHSGKLFKRDFAGEIMEKYPNMKLVDYGFAYHRDPMFMQGDGTWFLLEKTTA